MRKSFKLMSFHVISAVFVIIFALSLHVIDNAYNYSMDSGQRGYLNWAGVRVQGAFMYDLVLYLLIAFQLVVIILTLALYWSSKTQE